jgi:GAF domain-containing protein
VIVAVFSGSWLIRSLSLARSNDPDFDKEVMDWLQGRLFKSLAEAKDKHSFVQDLVCQQLERGGWANPTALVFGAPLERPGRIAVLIGASQALQDSSAAACAEHVAECVLGSRPAAFTLENSLELAVLSELRQAAEGARPSLSSLADQGRQAAIDALLAFAHNALGTWAIAAYEADESHPHRYDHLNRKSIILAAEVDPPEWIPDEVPLTEDLDIPVPPELGGSHFESLGELVDHCVASRRRPRRLVGVVAGEYHAYGVPYGFDDLRRRATGVLCLIWESNGARRMGAYEMAASRIIALHLARAYDDRQAGDEIRLVTSQLSFISGLPSSSQAGGLIGCDDILPGRRDVSLIAPSVSQIVRGLVDLSGAMSVTCRMITGAGGGPRLARYLARLHCEGDECALDSPHRIPIADSRVSVNAWVARTGRAVYLRTLEPEPQVGLYGSPDLDSYEGLEHASIFREGVRCELCVPIFAEQRLVGTVNLEADSSFAFDGKAETVAEYAQLIGIALLESRRRIGVETVTEVDGFLDYRHRLDSDLRGLGKKIQKEPQLAEALRDDYVATIEAVRGVVFMRRVAESDDLPDQATIREVISAAMKSVKWTTQAIPMHELYIGPFDTAAEAVYDGRVDRTAARALKFAIAQALHNVRNHGGSGDTLAGRQYSAMFRLCEAVIGGTRSLYVAVSSTCPPSTFDKLDPQRVFREPIDQTHRVSLGAFLAGEALRRCGGSAYMRVDFSDEHDAIVDAEFGVPAVG